jgi:hypothetical protein
LLDLSSHRATPPSAATSEPPLVASNSVEASEASSQSCRPAMNDGPPNVLGHVPARRMASASHNAHIPLAAELTADAAGTRLNPM